jgi:hypothetical protein
MKKIFFIASCFFLIAGDIYPSNLAVQLRATYLLPSEQAFKDVYDGGMTYGGEISIGIIKKIDLWAGGSYFSKNGKLTFTEEDTKVSIIPLGIGIKYKLLDGSIKPYVGLGLNYYQYKESNLLGDVSKGGLGFVAKAGGIFKISGGLLVDLFFGYSYCKMKPADFEINIGGLEAGIGIGYEF